MNWNCESGSSSMALVASLAVLGLTSLYVLESNRKNLNAIREAKLHESQELGSELNVSQFSRLRGLLSDVQIAPGVYEPGVYPVDYFSDSWTFQVQPHLEDVQGGIDLISFKSFSASSTSDQKLNEIFNGSKSLLDELSEPHTVRVVAKNRNKDRPFWVESIDVEAFSRVSLTGNQSSQSVKSKARIPLKAPVPHDLSVWISGPGKIGFDQNFGSPTSPLPAGNYTLQVRGSGVVYYAELILDGDRHTLGINLQAGNLTHKALSIKSKDQVIGEHTLNLNPSSSAGLTGSNDLSCENSLQQVTGGSNVREFVFQASAFGVDGQKAPMPSNAGTIYIQSQPVQNSAGTISVACNTLPSPTGGEMPLSVPQTQVGGVAGGHFDLDTSVATYGFNKGTTVMHVHEYDDKYNVTGVDFFNMLEPRFVEPAEALVGGQSFKIIVANAQLSPGAILTINGRSYLASEWQKLSQTEDLPVFSLTGTNGTQKLSALSVSFDPKKAIGEQLVPSQTGLVRSNAPGPGQTYRAGALTIQMIDSKIGKIDPSLGVAKNGGKAMLWEATLFWHTER
jgi:hypothetical protein